jgi:hypothetical protein
VEEGKVQDKSGYGQPLTSDASLFIVIDSRPQSLTNMTCDEDLANEGRQVTTHLSEQSSGMLQGFGFDKWRNMRDCLNGFIRRYPAAAGAHMQLASLDAAHGHWRAAAQRYTHAAKVEAAAATVIEQQQRLSEVLSLEQQQQQRPSCSWKSYTQCSGPPGDGTCTTRQTTQDAGVAGVVAEQDSDMFLSIIMVTRHDNTQYCQSPVDACLDRFRASMSALFSLLHTHSLASSTEVVLVEWNPCYANQKAEEGSCDARDGGYAECPVPCIGSASCRV